MTEIKTHADKYQHNIEFISIIGEEYSDWKITAIFYSALHLVERYLDGTPIGRVKRNHTARKKIIAQTDGLKKIYGNYDFLLNESIKSRYGFKTFKQKDIERAQSVLNKIEEDLFPADKH